MKFHGFVGFVDTVETAPDIWEEVPYEKEYSGDLLRKSNRSVVSTTTINDSIAINNQISIIAEPFINTHFPSIKYVKWNGAYWKVESADQTNYPRIILNLGGTYNGKTLETEPDPPRDFGDKQCIFPAPG